MKLIVLGSNGTYPTPGSPASGYVIDGSTRILMDCGPGVFPALLEHRLLPDVIVLSHGHADHCLDVLPLFNHVRFDRPDIRGIPLLAPRGVTDQLASFISAGPEHAFFDVFEPRVVVPGDRVVVAGASLDFGEATHPVPAVCVAVTAGDRSLVYSGDTGPDGDVLDLATGCDTLLCEATMQGSPDHARYPHHLYAREAGEIAAAAGVGRLLVTHVAPTLPPAVSVSEASETFAGPVDHASPGMEVEV